MHVYVEESCACVHVYVEEFLHMTCRRLVDRRSVGCLLVSPCWVLGRLRSAATGKILYPLLMMEHTVYNNELRAYDTATTNWPLASVCAYTVSTLDRSLRQINKAQLG
jgi:hypothetical protein